MAFCVSDLLLVDRDALVNTPLNDTELALYQGKHIE